MRLSRQIDVVRVTAFAAHEIWVLGALHRLADAELRRGQRGFRPVVHGGNAFEIWCRGTHQIGQPGGPDKNGTACEGCAPSSACYNFRDHGTLPEPAQSGVGRQTSV